MNTQVSHIGIGSNSPDAPQRIVAALDALSVHFSIAHASSTYSTPAINGVNPDYINAVVAISSPDSPEAITATLKKLEALVGRKAESKALGIVEIDLDLVVYQGQVLRPKDFCQEYFQIGYRQLNP